MSRICWIVEIATCGCSSIRRVDGQLTERKRKASQVAVLVLWLIWDTHLRFPRLCWQSPLETLNIRVFNSLRVISNL